MQSTYYSFTGPCKRVPLDNGIGERGNCLLCILIILNYFSKMKLTYITEVYYRLSPEEYKEHSKQGRTKDFRYGILSELLYDSGICSKLIFSYDMCF